MNPVEFLRALDRSRPMSDTACPQCQQQINHSTSVGKRDTPEPGDVSVCAFCDARLEYQADSSFRLMTDAEVAALPEYVLVSLLDAVQYARIMRKALKATSKAREGDQRIQAPEPE